MTISLADLKLDKLLKLPLKQKIGILLVVNAVFVGAIYYFLLAPTYAEIESLTAKRDRIVAKLDESRTIVMNIDKFRAEKAELEERLAVILKQLPNKKEIPDLIDSISEAGTSVGLKIILFKPGKEVSRGFYAEVPVNMSVQSSFRSLIEFCYKVGRLPRVVNISGMSVTAVQGSKGAEPMLKSEFVATTFRFVPNPPKNKGKGKKKGK